ncbi:MAG: acyl-CoA thioesterase [Bacilli bacterium]|nr:acyl-CoA thioesterase [Bacilli bacterium]
MISRTEIEVRYSETDQMGVVYHANYLVWFEVARSHFIKDLGFDYVDLENRGLLFPVREVHIEYFRPCFYGEKIYVETKVVDFNAIKTTYEQTIYNDTGELKAKGQVTLISVDKETFQITKINKKAPDIYAVYLKLIHKD